MKCFYHTESNKYPKKIGSTGRFELFFTYIQDASLTVNFENENYYTNKHILILKTARDETDSFVALKVSRRVQMTGIWYLAQTSNFCKFACEDTVQILHIPPTKTSCMYIILLKHAYKNDTAKIKLLRWNKVETLANTYQDKIIKFKTSEDVNSAAPDREAFMSAKSL